MSAAAKCDKCGELYEHTASALGADVHLEYSITTAVDEEGAPTQQGYDMELCPKCSASFLQHIGHEPAP